MTGGRVKRIKDYVGNETFMLTYGDGVADIDIRALAEFHKKHGKIATITTVNIGQRFGVIDINEDGRIESFREKNDEDGSMINGGYMVMNPEVFDYIEGDHTVFEKEPLENLARDGQLMAYYHKGFWKCMDTQRDKKEFRRNVAVQPCAMEGLERLMKKRMEDVMLDLNFFKDKNVLVTGHTGFKGSWLCKILSDAGAVVTGYSLKPPTDPNLIYAFRSGKENKFNHWRYSRF